MSQDDYPKLDSLVASLLARAPQMNFMQLCRLLELGVPEWTGFATQDAVRHEPVRFRPRPRMGFPAGEVAAVEFDDDHPEAPPTVLTTFMGLYGVDATMPSHMVDEIALREEGHEAVQSFLDQFNHRYVALLYRAWKKYRYPEQFGSGGSDPHSRRLLCLGGLGWGDKPKRAGLPDSRMLALLGLLIQRTRTPEGLGGVVALAIPGVGVRIEEFFPVFTSTGKAKPLSSGAAAVGSSDRGRGAGLGGGYVLGKQVAYRSRAVRVTLQPADDQQAHGLLPGEPLHKDLMAFVQLYVGVKADVHLSMQLPARLVPKPAIGRSSAGHTPRLGWTTLLSCAEEKLINIPLGIYEAFPVPPPNPYLTPQLD